MFEELIEIRDEIIFGETYWYWNIGDHGSWDGPKEDWINHHSKRYFEHLKQQKVVVTAGGNCGMYARLYSKLFETVYVFEPDAQNFHCLVNNCQTHNVIKMNCAVGAAPGFVDLKRPSPDNTGMHEVSGEGIIPLVTIDSFEFPHVDLLQLDIEGYEINAINGAIKTIERCQPVVIMERGATDAINKFMTELHYNNVGNSVADTIWVPS